jgi:hypothetical protein
MSDFYGNDPDRLQRFLRIRDRQAKQLHDAWLRAAKRALAGDMRALRLRVALAEAVPLEVVLSVAGGQEHDQ